MSLFIEGAGGSARSRIGLGYNLQLGRLLLVGDSVMIAKAADMKKLAGPQTTVVGPVENARNSSYTLTNIASWLSAGSANTVIWNNGLWNALIEEGADKQTTVDQYISDLEAIADLIISDVGADNIYFVHTTDIPMTNTTHEIGKEILLNDAADIVMADKEITVIGNLQSFTFENRYSFRDVDAASQADVHFNASGYLAQTQYIFDRLD